MTERRRRAASPPGKGPMAVYMPYHQTLFRYLLDGREDELRSRRQEPARSLTARFMSLLPWREVAGEQAIGVMKSFQGLLESSMADIVRTKSVYYWLHLSRRFLPGSNFGDESAATIWLYTHMEDCGYLKYGRMDSSSDFIDVVRPEDGERVASGNLVRAYEFFGMDARSGVVPGSEYVKDLDFNGLVEAAKVGRLAFEFWHTTACLRRLYKGGTLVVDARDPSEYHVYNDSETENLMKSYDQREATRGVLTTTSGLPISLTDIKDTGAAIGFYPTHNVNEVTEAELPQLSVVFNLKASDSPFAEDVPRLVPNFLWLPVDFSAVLDTNEFCDREFTEVHGVSLAKYLACLYAVSLLGTNRHIWTGMKFTGFETMQRAYSFWTSLDGLAHTILDIANDVGKHLQAGLGIDREEVDRVLNSLLLTEQGQGNICLTTLGPRPLLVPAGGARVLLDYAALGPILHSFTHGLENMGDKGARFEEHVRRAIGELPDVTPLWFSKQLRAADGTAREIDASYVKGRVLFLCELKCVGMSWAFSEGTRDALDFRRGKCEQGLQEAEDKALWLSRHPSGENYALPKEVSTIVPLLVSPFVEYVWSRDPMLWLTDEVPRICTPRELKEIDPGASEGRPFALTVLRNTSV